MQCFCYQRLHVCNLYFVLSDHKTPLERQRVRHAPLLSQARGRWWFQRSLLRRLSCSSIRLVLLASQVQPSCCPRRDDSYYSQKPSAQTDSTLAITKTAGFRNMTPLVVDSGTVSTAVLLWIWSRPKVQFILAGSLFYLTKSENKNRSLSKVKTGLLQACVLSHFLCSAPSSHLCPT